VAVWTDADAFRRFLGEVKHHKRPTELSLTIGTSNRQSLLKYSLIFLLFAFRARAHKIITQQTDTQSRRNDHEEVDCAGITPVMTSPSDTELKTMLVQVVMDNLIYVKEEKQRKNRADHP